MNPAASAYSRSFDARITVPVAADGSSAMLAGRHTVVLTAYMNRSTSSAGAANSSPTRSSATRSGAPGASA